MAIFILICNLYDLFSTSAFLYKPSLCILSFQWLLIWYFVFFTFLSSVIFLFMSTICFFILFVFNNHAISFQTDCNSQFCILMWNITYWITSINKHQLMISLFGMFIVECTFILFDQYILRSHTTTQVIQCYTYFSVFNNC